MEWLVFVAVVLLVIAEDVARYRQKRRLQAEIDRLTAELAAIPAGPFGCTVVSMRSRGPVPVGTVVAIEPDGYAVVAIGEFPDPPDDHDVDLGGEAGGA